MVVCGSWSLASRACALGLATGSSFGSSVHGVSLLPGPSRKVSTLLVCTSESLHHMPIPGFPCRIGHRAHTQLEGGQARAPRVGVGGRALRG